jgi:hypothetical protein
MKLMSLRPNRTNIILRWQSDLNEDVYMREVQPEVIDEACPSSGYTYLFGGGGKTTYPPHQPNAHGWGILALPPYLTLSPVLSPILPLACLYGIKDQTYSATHISNPLGISCYHIPDYNST